MTPEEKRAYLEGVREGSRKTAELVANQVRGLSGEFSALKVEIDKLIEENRQLRAEKPLSNINSILGRRSR